ncbi:MAG: hypothetical protein JWO38_5762 [Gemmataceae bacterium]|nr:hypothetical protein [Gemmataceae bacterium]
MGKASGGNGLRIQPPKESGRTLPLGTVVPARSPPGGVSQLVGHVPALMGSGQLLLLGLGRVFECLLTRLLSPAYSHEESQRVQLDRMRQAVADLLRQPSLF